MKPIEMTQKINFPFQSQMIICSMVYASMSRDGIFPIVLAMEKFKILVLLIAPASVTNPDGMNGKILSAMMRKNAFTPLIESILVNIDL